MQEAADELLLHQTLEVIETLLGPSPMNVEALKSSISPKPPQRIVIRAFRRATRHTKASEKSCVSFSSEHRIGRSRFFEIITDMSIQSATVSLVALPLSSGPPAFTLNTHDQKNFLQLTFNQTEECSKKASFLLHPTKRPNYRGEHALTFNFLTLNGEKISHTITNIYPSNHKHESGHKQMEFYNRTNSFLTYHPGLRSFIIEEKNNNNVLYCPTNQIVQKPNQPAQKLQSKETPIVVQCSEPMEVKVGVAPQVPLSDVPFSNPNAVPAEFSEPFRVDSFSRTYEEVEDWNANNPTYSNLFCDLDELFFRIPVPELDTIDGFLHYVRDLLE